MDKAKPYPAIITNTPWVINETYDESNILTDNLNNQMTVPLAKNCEFCGVNHYRYVRRLQLGHAKWSPKTIGKLKPNVRREAVSVLSDVRIAWILSKQHMEYVSGTKCPALILKEFDYLLQVGSVAEILMFLLKYVTFDHQVRYTYRAYDALGDSIQHLNNLLKYYSQDMRFTLLRQSEYHFVQGQLYAVLNLLIDKSNKDIIPFNRVKVAAEYLSMLLNEFFDRPKEEDIWDKSLQTGGTGERNESEDEGENSEEADEDSSQVGGSSEEQRLQDRMRKELMKEISYHSTGGIGRWGKMDIHEPTLTVNLNSRLKNGRGYRASNMGHNPRKINRYCIDKQIFQQRHRVKGGTILIDASGSMRFDGADILEIMEQLPAVNIAMYNGYGITGSLRVIAKGGRRVHDDYLWDHKGGGNVVDGPALRWLAEMPQRRIWVSDMKVFGAGKNSSAFNLLKDCYDICTQNKIINLKDIEEVKEYALKLNM